MFSEIQWLFRRCTLCGPVWVSLACLCCLPALGHIHVQIGYRDNAWDLHVYDFDSGRSEASEIAFGVGLGARRPIPADPRFEAFLGPAGSPVWILPQNEVEGLLNLGVGTTGIRAGVFESNLLRLVLRRLEGPGDFAVFSNGSLGEPVVHLASRDGISGVQDRLSVPAVSGHLHVNWAFTAPGDYVVGLGVEGRLVAGGVMSVSETVEYRFRVEGPKPARLRSPRRLGEQAMVFTLESEPGGVWNLETSKDARSWDTWIQVTNVTGTLEIQSSDLRHSEAVLFRAVQPGLVPTRLGIGTLGRASAVSGEPTGKDHAARESVSHE
jgi:surface-anchored protein